MFRTFDIMDLSPIDAGSESEFDAGWGSLPIGHSPARGDGETHSSY
jgi:hypothetical protein